MIKLVDCCTSNQSVILSYILIAIYTYRDDEVYCCNVTSGILFYILVETVLCATVTAVNVSSLKQRVDALEKLVTEKINNLENELAQKTDDSENLEQKVNSLEAKIVEIQKQLEYGGRNYQRLAHRSN